MNKIIKNIMLIIIICFMIVSAYLGYKLFMISNENEDVINEINDISKEIDDAENQIDKLNLEINELKESKSAAFSEYTTWKRQNQKLEEILK